MLADLTPLERELLEACKFALKSIETRKQQLLKPDPTMRDWATVEYTLRQAIANAEARAAAAGKEG